MNTSPPLPTGAAAPSAPRLLADARHIARNDAAIPTATWGRAVALLARQAMELALSDYWAQVDPTMTTTRNTRASFLCLASVLPEDEARRAYYSWSLLSRACHHRNYDLEPSFDEVQQMLAGADRFVRLVGVELSRAQNDHDPAETEETQR